MEFQQLHVMCHIFWCFSGVLLLQFYHGNTLEFFSCQTVNFKHKRQDTL